MLHFQSSLLLIMPLLADNDCNWAGGTMCCNIMGFFALSLLLVSPLFTILMAFDRVIALYKPFKYRNHLGLKVSTLKFYFLSQVRMTDE